MTPSAFRPRSTNALFQISVSKCFNQRSPKRPARGVSAPLARAALIAAVIIACLTAGAKLASAQSVTFTGSGAVDFGSVNVCQAGQTTPAPCSNTLTLTYNVTASGTLGTPLVLTAGTPNLDFTLASGSTCISTVTAGNTCTVKVTFAPLTSGLRMGGVQVVDGSGNVLSNTYVSGIGIPGPAVAYISSPRDLTPNNNPFGVFAVSGKAIDGSGNIFSPLSTTMMGGKTEVAEITAVDGVIPPNSTIKTIATGFKYATALALDGSGNIFVCDYQDRTVKEIVAAGGYKTVKTIASSTLGPWAIDVDRNGNVIVGTMNDTETEASLLEILSVNGAIPENPTVNVFGGFSAFDQTQSIAVDRSGNVFVVDSSFSGDYPTSALKEIVAVNGIIPPNPTINTLLSYPNTPGIIAFDGNGNLIFPTGYPFQGMGEILAVNGSIPLNPSIVPLISGNIGSVDGILIDRIGNIFTSYIDIEEYQRAQPPSLSFATTTPGYTSTDSPQSVQIQNVGSADLIGTVSASTDWDLATGSGTPADCPASFSLAPGAQCNLNISFEPTEVGALTGAVTLQDNAQSSATQSIPLSGTGAPPSITALSANYGALYASITLKGSNFGPIQGTKTVTFSGVQAFVSSWSDTSITATVPGGATSGNVVVSANGYASNGIPFTVVSAPSVTGFDPTSGPVGTVVTITGQNLLDAQGRGQVWLNTISLPIVSQTNTSLQVKLPPGVQSGPLNVHVNGVGRYTALFTVPESAKIPGITGISARYGAWYANITLTGFAFGAVQGSSSVTFTLPNAYSRAAQILAWSDTSIFLSVPYLAGNGTVLTAPVANNITVTANGLLGNSIAFTVQPSPSLTAISPASGPVGTLVTISGQNLIDAGGRGKVWFGNVNAPILSQSSTSIQVQVPAGATSVPVNVHVNGVGRYTPTFTVTN